MGFYVAQQNQDRASSAATTPWGPKPSRGPISNAISGHRFYNPELGRWVSRDPVNEKGFRYKIEAGKTSRSNSSSRKSILLEYELNTYCFVKNGPTLFVDLLGLYNPVLGPKEIIIDDQGNISTTGQVIGPGHGGLPPGGVPPDERGSIGIGAYIGIGASTSRSVIYCCKKGCQYKYTILTVCAGAGLSKGVNPYPSPTTSSDDSIGECPSDRKYYFKVSGSIHAVKGGSIDWSWEIDEYPWEADRRGQGETVADIDVGVTATYCSDTVVGKELMGSCD